MRIFRTIFFLSAIAILAPSPPDQGRTSVAFNDTATSVPAVIYAANRTVSDLGNFCGRQPMVCVTADFIASRLEAKAKYSAKLIYEWANEAGGVPVDRQALAADSLVTAGIVKIASGSDRASQNTLKVEDLIPDWRDPRRVRRT